MYAMMSKHRQSTLTLRGLLCALALAAALPAAAQKAYQTIPFAQKFNYTTSYPSGIASNGAVLADSQIFRNGACQTLPQLSGYTIYTAVNASLSTTGFVANEDWSLVLGFVRTANGKVRYLN